MNGLSMYNNGCYLSKNPGWHENDAAWKASQVLSLLGDRSFRPESIVDVGCGTGGVLEVIADALNGTRLVGYDPSSQAIGLVERSDRVELRVGTPEDVHEHYDLLLSLDVFEHVEDYIGFLRSLRPIADWFIFHIPLDASAQSVVRERPLLTVRSSIGHLHYFTRGTALASLETAGFEIIRDRLLFPNDMSGRRLKTRIANIPRNLGRHLRPQLSARILGGSTLLVLASAPTGGRFPATPNPAVTAAWLAVPSRTSCTPGDQAATDHDSPDWQLMAGSARRDTSPRISARERAQHIDEPRAEVGAAYSPALSVRVLLVADVRSPTTWGWVDAVRSAGVVVLGVDGLPWPEHRPLSASCEGSRRGARQRLRSLAGATPKGLQVIGRVRRAVGPLLAAIKGRRLRRVMERAKPDVVHGLRIPYEAMAALAACPPDVPLAVSIWGNDLTHEATRSRRTRRATRRVLARTDLLFADCQRDIDLAGTWGLRPTTPTAVLPGGGGIDLARVADEGRTLTSQLSDLAGSDHRLVVNARGSRPYVRNEVLLESLSILATDLDPRVRVVFVDSAHDAALRRAIERHRLGNRIIVTGRRSLGEVFSLLRRAEISVSITDQDGTPNSLLEAMAAGAIPVCGDLPSIREWIEPGRNGFLAAFNDPQAVADALRLALGLCDAERRAIRTENGRIVAARAERGSAGKQAAEKYRTLVMHREELAPCARRHVSSQDEATVTSPPPP